MRVESGAAERVNHEPLTETASQKSQRSTSSTRDSVEQFASSPSPSQGSESAKESEGPSFSGAWLALLGMAAASQAQQGQKQGQGQGQAQDNSALQSLAFGGLLSLITSIVQGKQSGPQAQNLSTSSDNRAVSPDGKEQVRTQGGSPKDNQVETRGDRHERRTEIRCNRDGSNTLRAAESWEWASRSSKDSYEAAARGELAAEARTHHEGKHTGDVGTAEGRHDFSLGAYARGDARVKANKDGLAAKSHAEAGVGARHEAEARVATHPMKVNGATIQPEAKGKFVGLAGAHAAADLDAEVKPEPPTAAVDAKAGAFAGARAHGEGEVGVGPAKVKGEAEAWVGAGAEAHVTAGVKDGKFRFGYGAGVAWGYGFKLGWQVEVDPKQLATLFGGEAFGKLFEGMGSKTVASGGKEGEVTSSTSTETRGERDLLTGAGNTTTTSTSSETSREGPPGTLDGSTPRPLAGPALQGGELAAGREEAERAEAQQAQQQRQKKSSPQTRKEQRP